MYTHRLNDDYADNREQDGDLRDLLKYLQPYIVYSIVRHG